MIWHVIHIIDILLWLLMAASVIYVCFFAFISIFKGKEKHPSTLHLQPSTFLILYPAYHEDAVIVHSIQQFLLSDYPKERYHLAVISDHMEDTTNKQLASLSITLHQPVFEKSSKAKALQYAIQTELMTMWLFLMPTTW